MITTHRSQLAESLCSTPYSWYKLRWFEAPLGFVGHVANAFESEEGQVEISIAFSKLNVFFWWSEKEGKGAAAKQPQVICSKWTIDPSSGKSSRHK